MILSIILAIVGVYIIIKSSDIGSNVLEKYVSTTAGGNIDTGEYLTRLQIYVKSYIVLGSILLFSGLLSLSIFTSVQVYKENKAVK